MMGQVFSSTMVLDSYATVMACDKERFNRFFHAMLDGGVFLAASQFGIPVSTTHNVSAAIMGVVAGAVMRPDIVEIGVERGFGRRLAADRERQGNPERRPHRADLERARDHLAALAAGKTRRRRHQLLRRRRRAQRRWRFSRRTGLESRAGRSGQLWRWSCLRWQKSPRSHLPQALLQGFRGSQSWQPSTSRHKLLCRVGYAGAVFQFSAR